MGHPDVAERFLAELSRRTAVMAAAWQSVGFVHGVLNTGARGAARAAFCSDWSERALTRRVPGVLTQTTRQSWGLLLTTVHSAGCARRSAGKGGVHSL